ncbi:hypothetical protein K501DRAFT_292286 [Backusella circina FSU 941]|nr:hypothetical protein K501DRAFT_204280 [Backusella circina FSU 941]KAI8887364.1 hypothetical protein K501DRAFT_292286 [Backusella circina FSU 941]
MIDILSTALDQITRQLEGDWTNKTQKRLEQQRRHILSLMTRQYDKIDKRLKRDAKTVRLRDKIAFVVGVGNTCVAPALAVRYPQYIPLYYSVQFTVLLILRYFIYRSRQWHYFIFDNCYFVNVMTLLVCWVSDSRALFLATFALTSGPVATAIITWRNSLVFHSLDKVTSLFIHIFPPLVMYCIRWMPELLRDSVYCDNVALVTAFRNQRYPAAGDLGDPSFGDMMLYATLAFAVWQILYYVFVMIQKREKVESGLRLTSYSWLLGSDPSGKQQGGLIQRVAFAFGPKWKLEMFVLLQTVYSIVTFIPTVFMFRYFWLHSAFLVAMFAVSVWNGANYYIEVFSRRYIMELEKIKPDEKKS